MNEQDNQADIPDFHQDLLVEENQQRNFFRAMIEARFIGSPIQAFQNLLKDAPPVSVEALYFLTGGFFGHANVMQLLLEHEPKIARHWHPYAGLLLHRAIQQDPPVPVDTIELILNAYPDAISESYRDGLLPLHLACERERSVQTLELLLSRYPGAASVYFPGRGGEFPLHRFLQRIDMNRSDESNMALIDVYPEAASVETRRNETALHLASQSGFSLVIVQRLYRLYPVAVMLENNAGQIPLHVACDSMHSSVEVIKFLLQMHSDGAQSKDIFDQLPLHYSARRIRAPLEVVQTLIDAYPNAVNVTDNNGKLALHFACRYGASLEVIQLLLDHYTGDEEHNNGLSITDNDGCVPMHHYVRDQNVSSETVKYLLDLYPGGIHAVDNEVMLPIHHACSANRPRHEIIRLLVEAAPFTVIQTSVGGRTPLRCAFRRGQLRGNVEIETYLIERQNEAVNATKEAFVDVANAQLGLPDLVIANVWSFAKPDVWTPTEEDWREDENDADH